MFRQGELVVHPGEGVCRVEDVRTEEFQKGQPREYYLLRPMAAGGMTVYLPVDQTRVPLRPIMDAERARTLHDAAQAAESVWVANDRERQERFTAILHAAEPEAMMRMVLDIREQQAARRQRGKKLRFTDEHALQEAERLLKQELELAVE